ncbi:MAG: transcription antitermination factor NusB [Ruminococcaceae bacterium]|nr:transcription antitermination factor NusB [Oscillospiraceae bacterium]
MTRREAREQAFIVLFEKIFDSDASISDIVATAKEAELIKINNFAENILNAVEENFVEIDEVIEANSQDWTLARLPKVSLSILRLAVAEIKYIDEVPNGVAVNEAVELAKKYGTNEDANFINGILGTIAKA